MIQVEEVLTIGPEASAQANVVYSTAPRQAECHGGTYFIKGPDLDMVFAEVVGCELARLAGLLVPEVAICVTGEERYAGSKMLQNCIRDVSPWLRRNSDPEYIQDSLRAVVVDVWLCNTDRNLGNILVSPSGQERHKFYFIDFEKSVVLRSPHSFIESAMKPDRELWPSGDLGTILRQHKGLIPPLDVIQRIHHFTNAEITSIVNDASLKLGGIHWAENSAAAIVHRASKIEELANRVWELS